MRACCSLAPRGNRLARRSAPTGVTNVRLGIWFCIGMTSWWAGGLLPADSSTQKLKREPRPDSAHAESSDADARRAAARVLQHDDIASVTQNGARQRSREVAYLRAGSRGSPESAHDHFRDPLKIAAPGEIADRLPRPRCVMMHQRFRSVDDPLTRPAF